MRKMFHITNGSSLTDYLNELNFSNDVLTWHEMLCEGPTTKDIDTDVFFNLRKSFLHDYYNVEIDEYAYKNELHKLDNLQEYSEIVLWFEYDLFCHINMVAVISLLQQKGIELPISLVCSGRIQGEDNLKGLSELTPDQLDYHYKTRVRLNKNDIAIATSIWETYCGKDHNLLKPFITQESSFKYMGCCLKAHLNRFPDSLSGLSTLEYNMLSLIKNHDIKSKHHLLGYALNYQGYYGFGDMQINRIIDKLALFYDVDASSIKLNRTGHEAILSQSNFAAKIDNQMVFGGVNCLDYQFNQKKNKLIKTSIHVN